MNVMLFLEGFDGCFLRHDQDRSLYLVRFIEGQLRARNGIYEGRLVDTRSGESIYKLSNKNRRFIEIWEEEGIIARGAVRKDGRKTIDV